MALDPKVKTKIIIGSILGVALLVGAGFGINYIVSNNARKKSEEETSRTGKGKITIGTPVGILGTPIKIGGTAIGGGRGGVAQVVSGRG